MLPASGLLRRAGFFTGVGSVCFLFRCGSDHAAAFFGNRCGGAAADPVDLDREAAHFEFTAAEQLDRPVNVPDQAVLVQGDAVDGGVRREYVQVGQVDQLVADLQAGAVETTLRQAENQGGTAAFPARRLAEPAAGTLALVAAAAGLAASAAVAASHPAAYGLAARLGLEIIQFHALLRLLFQGGRRLCRPCRARQECPERRGYRRCGAGPASARWPAGPGAYR